MFKERIKLLRSEKDLTQQELGNIVGVTQQAVGRWEKGLAFPDQDSLNKLADFFGVTTDYLLGRDSDKPTKEMIEFINFMAENGPIKDPEFLEYVKNATPEQQLELFNAAAEIKMENGKPKIVVKRLRPELQEIKNKINELKEQLKNLPPHERKAFIRMFIDEFI